MERVIIIFLLVLISYFAKGQCTALENPRPSINTNLVECIGETKQVGIYFEADSIFTYAKGGFALCQKYIRDSLFKAVQELYKKDSINIYYAGSLPWLITDPYYNLSISNKLIEFSNRMSANPPKADLYCLLSGGPYNQGGIAYVGVLGSPAQYRVSVCSIYPNQTPSSVIYNWNTEVIAHELGHNLGSQHTQWCGWEGGPIDTCWNPEGGCYSGALQFIQNGSIMSYCHLNGAIDFKVGFLTQPSKAIKTHICNNQASLINPDTVINNCIPLLLPANVISNTATLSWSNNGSKYRYTYKVYGSTTWEPVKEVTVNSVYLNNLLHLTKYQWKVKSYCNGKWQIWSKNGTFKTK